MRPTPKPSSESRGKDLRYYDVARYRDAKILLTHQTFCNMFDVDLLTKFLSKDSKYQTGFLNTILYLNSCAHWACRGSDLPLIPSTADIKQNIEENKVGAAPAPTAPQESDPLHTAEMLMNSFEILKPPPDHTAAYEDFVSQLTEPKCRKDIEAFHRLLAGREGAEAA